MALTWHGNSSYNPSVRAICVAESEGAMTDMEDNEDVILLPVPKRFYARMVQALAQEIHKVDDRIQDTTPAKSTLLEVEPSVVKSWRRDEIAQLQRIVDNPTVRTLLNLAAQRRGDWVTFTELMERLGRTSDGIRADLAGLTRLCHRQFYKEGLNTQVWPIEIDWRMAPSETTRYRMPREISRWWLEPESPIDRQQAIRTLIEEFIQGEQGVVFDFSTSWYATWTLGPAFANVLDQDERPGIGWTPSKRVLLFSVQFGPDPNKPKPAPLHFSLIVGPASDERIREKLMELAPKGDLFPHINPPTKRKALTWDVIRSDECLDAEEYATASPNEAIEAFAKTWHRLRDNGTLDAIRAAFRPVLDRTWWYID